MTRKFRRPTLALLAVPVLAASLIAGCGSDNAGSEGDQPDAGLTAVKSYLTDHATELAAQTAELKTAGNAYYDLAKEHGFNYRKMLRSDRESVEAELTDAKNAFAKANPAYQQIKGIVAGIPRTAQYDTDIDTGSDASEARDPVSFNLTLPNGRILQQPGNLFSLIETALYGTDPGLVARGVKPDVNGNGKVDFGEGLPEANTFKAVVDEIDRQAGDLEKDAREIVITPSDAFTVVAGMTPTMSQYFEEWRLSAFVAGEDNWEEARFVATSRLSDVADILAGIDFTYEEIEPLIAEENVDQAEQTASELSSLLATAEDLRDREAAGERFTARQAEDLGAAMQSRAERIAIQVTQAAEELDIEIQES